MNRRAEITPRGLALRPHHDKRATALIGDLPDRQAAVLILQARLQTGSDADPAAVTILRSAAASTSSAKLHEVIGRLALDIARTQTYPGPDHATVATTTGLGAAELAVTMLPQNESAWRCYATNLKLSGRLTEAVSAYDRALDLDPANADTYIEQQLVMRLIENIASAESKPRIAGNRDGPEFTRLLTPAEAASLLRVDPKTVTRWARDGKLSSIRTRGGHRRYSEAEVRALLDQIRGGTRPVGGL